MGVLFDGLPTILTVYQAYEDLGYDKDKILQKFKDHTYIERLKSKTAAVTYTSVGQGLSDMDSSRHSWTNEDPDWRSLASSLDIALAPGLVAAISGIIKDTKKLSTPLALSEKSAVVRSTSCRRRTSLTKIAAR